MSINQNEQPIYRKFSSTSNDEDYEINLEEKYHARIKKRKRDRMQAYFVMFIFFAIVFASIIYFITSDPDNKNNNTIIPKNNSSASDDSINVTTTDSIDNSVSEGSSKQSSESSKDSKEDSSNTEAKGHDVKVIDGITYIDDILIVNKTYSLPSDYAPGLINEVNDAFYAMSSDAYTEGIVLYVCSGYRSYQEQERLYNSYVAERGAEAADRVSSKPGHSEHQTGLCIDVNSTDFNFQYTKEAKWLEENCAKYGFIIRYPKDKEDITGYAYEAWHIRYVGEKSAKEISESGLCLEEYLNISSNYENSKSN